jgi:cytosine/uracil/thiamine/allantoin permease
MSLILKKTVYLICLLALLFCSNSICLAGTCQGTDGSAYWSTLAHEENSVVASIIYIPYLVLQIPVRIIDAIVDPKPTSKATMPPQAHKGPGVLR